MKSFLLLVFIGYWISLSMHPISLFLVFGILYGIYLFSLYKKKYTICIWIACLLVSFLVSNCMNPIPKKGNYQVYEIKNHYVLATDGTSKIVLYGIEHPNYKYTYSISSFDEIHSLNNIGLYNFEEAMHKKGIDYSSNCSDDNLIKTSSSIKCKMYSYLSTHTYASLYKKVFYGIYDDESMSLFSRLSLPFIGFIKMLETLFNKKFNKKKSKYCSILIGILLGYIFTFTVGYLRFLIYEIVSLLWDDWKMKYSISGLLFLTFFHEYALDFIFLFPFGLQFISHYTKGYYRTISIFTFSILCQCIYFHEVNILFLFFFSFFRQVYVIQFLLLCLGFFNPICIEPVLFMNQDIKMFTIHYMPNVLFTGFGVYILYTLMKHERIQKILILNIAFVASMFILPYSSIFYHVYMLDIGQGDCTILVEPFLKSVVMIDCGGNLYRDNAKDIILPFLENLHIKEIDTLIITHDDFDHSGCEEELLKNIPIFQVIKTRDKQVDVDYPFYSLLENREAKDENDQSILSYFVYDGIHYLWMADASIDIEKQLLQTYNLEVDILKLGHHGSSTSSSYAFLDSLRPKIGLVSVGLHNKYGHPSTEVLSNCIHLGIQPIQTSKEGMIHLFSYHGYLFFETGSGLFGVIKP